MAFHQVSGSNRLHLLLRLVPAAAQSPWRFKVEFHQVSARGEVARVQLDRRLELPPDLSREQETVGSLRCEAIRPAEPQVRLGRTRLKLDCPLGIDNGLVVLSQLKVAASKPQVRLGVLRISSQRLSGGRAHFGTLPCIKWVSHCIQASGPIRAGGLSCLERLGRSRRKPQPKGPQCQNEGACSDSSDFRLHRHWQITNWTE